MVNLMLQPVFLNLVKGSTDHKMTSDDLYNMWSVASRAKSAIVQGRRLENLSWRLWYTSTIRSKIEMEEKRRREKDIDLEINNSDNYDNYDNSESELFIETETESTSPSSTTTHRRNRKKKGSTLVLPSDRPLFTSTCTSILAEIQDASFRFSSTATTMGNNINQSHFITSYNNNSSGYNISSTHNHISHSSHNHSSHSHNVHIISPPTNRAKSPGTSISSNNSTPKRKKNVEKFLKKFKSNLEDISEQFDEKLNFSDEETGEEHVTTKVVEEQHTDASIKSLSPTASSNHFATDEEGQFSSFYTRDDTDIRPVMIKKKDQPSMISKLLKKEASGPCSIDSNSTSVNSNTCNESINSTTPHTNNRLKAPNFLFNQNGKSINDQLKLMAASNNKYTGTSTTGNLDEKRVIDANALSTSLSASKFKLEDEFDSQLVIW